MLVKKRKKKFISSLFIKFICVLTALELIVVSFGFCGHSHEQWNDLNQIRENRATSTFKTNDLHSHTKTDHNSQKNNQPHCNFRCPCNGGINGVLNTNALQIIAAQNQYFHYKPQLHEFSIIPSIFHPPLATN